MRVTFLIVALIVNLNSVASQVVIIINEHKLNLDLDDKILVENQLVSNPHKPNNLLEP